MKALGEYKVTLLMSIKQHYEKSISAASVFAAILNGYSPKAKL